MAKITHSGMFADAYKKNILLGILKEEQTFRHLVQCAPYLKFRLLKLKLYIE